MARGGKAGFDRADSIWRGPIALTWRAIVWGPVLAPLVCGLWGLMFFAALAPPLWFFICAGHGLWGDAIWSACAWGLGWRFVGTFRAW